jgi:hypothetical protein
MRRKWTLRADGTDDTQIHANSVTLDEIKLDRGRPAVSPR